MLIQLKFILLYIIITKKYIRIKNMENDFQNKIA